MDRMGGVTLEQVVEMSNLDKKGKKIILDAARHAKWTPEQLAQYYYNACKIGGRDVAVTLAEMAYDL